MLITPALTTTNVFLHTTKYLSDCVLLRARSRGVFIRAFRYFHLCIGLWMLLQVRKRFDMFSPFAATVRLHSRQIAFDSSTGLPSGPGLNPK